MTEGKPHWYIGTRDDWNALSTAQREAAKNIYSRTQQKVATGAGQAPAQPAPQASSSAPAGTLQALVEAASEQPKELLDLRDWDYDFDGIPAERIRNCIMYHLDHKKDKWVRDNMTEHLMKRMHSKLGITWARKLHQDTPPGWVPPERNPLIKIVAMKIDDDAIEVTMPGRRAKNRAEWQKLQKLLLDSRGLVNSNIVPFVVDPKCQLCHGTGFEAVLAHPDNPRLRWQKRSRDCSCIFKNPFA
jgi:hypothetical protein